MSNNKERDGIREMGLLYIVYSKQALNVVSILGVLGGLLLGGVICLLEQIDTLEIKEHDDIRILHKVLADAMVLNELSCS